MELVVKAFSGLGNQLFQYAAGRYYADLHHAKLRVASDLPHRAMSHGEFPRPFLLSYFAIPEEPHTVTSWDRLMLSDKPRTRVASAPLKKLLRVQIFHEPLAERYRFLQSLPLQPGTRTAYLAGYWQTHRLIEAMSPQLRRELTFKQAATGKNLDVLNLIRNTPNSVSLHIRRGDFTLAVEGNIALPAEYYGRAISLMLEKTPDATFYVFSDDVPFAREFLPKSIRSVFIDHNNDFSSHEDLRLMSSCQNHILANSTFSWWGAWLNARTSKVVIAPRHWLLTKQSYYADLMPPEWLLLDTDLR